MNDTERRINHIYYIHDEKVNQKYDKILPYSFHLKIVVSNVNKYYNHCTFNCLDDLLLAAAGHDLIEDARYSYHDVKGITSDIAADIIYCCTDEKGKNRKQKHSQKYFDELKQNREAVFVKLCDVLANVTFSLLTDSSMFHKYKQEFIKLEKELYQHNECDKL